ncbi:MAG: integrase core domain-containing protein, partial [Gammaproteobacteria bacterium]
LAHRTPRGLGLFFRKPGVRQMAGRSGIHHRDRGSQQVSIRYTERFAEAGIEPSVGSKGHSYDNALAETINGLYKAELIHRRPWKNREAVELATLQWVHWFNHQRLLGSIGYIPPVEAEANFYRQQAGQAMATLMMEMSHAGAPKLGANPSQQP